MIDAIFTWLLTNGHITGASVVTLILVAYIYKTNLMVILAHIKGMLRIQEADKTSYVIHEKDTREVLEISKEIHKDTANLDNMGDDIRSTKDSIAKVEGMLSVMSINTTRSLK